MPKSELLIDGINPKELSALEDLEAYTIAGHPIVFSIGNANILAEFTRSGTTLLVEIATVEKGGEGVLPVLINTIENAALQRAFTSIEWFIYARNCATPNPKLMKVLENTGFEVKGTEESQEYHWQRCSTNDSLLRRNGR